MSVSLEPLVPQEEPVPQVEIEEPPAPQEEEPPIVEEANTPAAPPVQTMVEEVTAPAPKRRGRPKKDPTVKAAPKKAVKMKVPQPPTPESSDGDEPIDRDDMETLLLDYLVKRKRSQQDARRNMWAQLAGLR